MTDRARVRAFHTKNSCGAPRPTASTARWLRLPLRSALKSGIPRKHQAGGGTGAVGSVADVAGQAASMEDAPGFPPAGTSDGGSTSYYELPAGATELNDLIEHKGMSFAPGNIFKACYRFGEKDAANRMYERWLGKSAQLG
ncbi:hypothetical protein [Brucella anthropi]|uniref:hypothetical protein n=1 Tax=Brucella anthropi TaxID=529 RepID=UPI001F27C128|nr:hypothetical protein [Brucella anthropi]